MSRQRVLLLLLAGLTAVFGVTNVWPSVADATRDGQYELPPNSTPVEAVRAIAVRHNHGWVDDQLTQDQLSKVAIERPVVTTCLPLSNWAVKLLADIGIAARPVTVLTLDEWNGWADSHAFIEVRESDRWVAYDIDRKVRWTDERGHGLSMVEWLERVPAGDYRIVPLLGPVDESDLRVWDRRYGQVALIGVGDGWWFPSQGDANRILSASPAYVMLDPDEWHTRFDGGTT